MNEVDYDVIVIGSGAGGLAAAVALAQSGKKVLVCEQHGVPGGWTHSFVLNGYRFNTGVHYIGELGPKEMLRRIYEGLGVTEDLSFMELNPQGYDHLFIGDERFDIPKGREHFIARLKERFPSEARGIDRFFKRISDINIVLRRLMDGKSLLTSVLTLPWLMRTGQTLINRSVKDRLLRAILAGQSGCHGMPPSRVSAATHAAIMQHYISGAYHPLGGGLAIPRAFVRALKRAGGEIRMQTPVSRIIIADGRTVGVELSGGEVLRANFIISNADPHMTFTKLVGSEHLSAKLRRKLARVTYSTSCLSLFLTVDLDLKEMGFDSGNYWFHEHDDIDQIYRQGLQSDAAFHAPSTLFATVTSLKDPVNRRDSFHTMEVFTFVSYDAFAKYENEPFNSRSAEYKQLKAEIMERMLTVLEKRIPGIRRAVVYKELGTPLSNAHFIKAYQGNAYGTEKSVRQSGPGGFGITTEFANLFHCGSSTISHGIAAVTISGLMAAATILRCQVDDLLKQSGPELKVYSCEDSSSWPQELQRQS